MNDFTSRSLRHSCGRIFVHKISISELSWKKKDDKIKINQTRNPNGRFDRSRQSMSQE